MKPIAKPSLTLIKTTPLASIIHSQNRLWKREGKKMSQNEKRVEISDRRNYRIDIGAYGSIGIEAPTKDECLELFKEVTRTKRHSSIEEAIR
jgi:hypothetical protein